MKKIIAFFAIALSVAVTAQQTEKKAGPPAGNAAPGDTYGATITSKAEKSAMDVATLQQKLQKTDKLENITVRGKVTEVCAKKGCWITVETPDKEEFFVKMKDYAFFVPTALTGKNVVLEGVAEKKVISVEEQQHYAEDAKKPKEEIELITQPKEEVRFLASGIKVVK